MKLQPSLSFDNQSTAKGFSLIEVVLAIGIFLVTVLALVGLLGPTLKSVDDVEETDEIVSVVNSINAFLQNSPAIAGGGGSKFDNIFQAVASDDYAEMFVFQAYRAPDSTDKILKIGFFNEAVPNAALLTAADFSDAAGQIFRVVLSPSSVLPETGVAPNGTEVTYRSTDRDEDSGIYSLAPTNVDDYHEGYFAMEVRIFSREADMQAINGTLPTPTLAELAEEEPIFTYNTAVVR